MRACDREAVVVASSAPAQARAMPLPKKAATKRGDPGNVNPLLPTILCLAIGHATAQSKDASIAPASATKTPPAVIVQQVRVAPGALCGRIVDSGTRRPIPAHAFALLDNTGEKIGDVTTTAEGTYTTPVLANGNYTLLVRNDLKLHLIVDANAKISNLDIVLPQGPKKLPQNPANLPAAPGGAAALPAPLGAPGLGAGAWAVVAGGAAAAAVAVPVVANNSGSDSENQVSASGLGVRR
jgi:hypothetical protein